jgi:hypothetical protein
MEENYGVGVECRRGDDVGWAVGGPGCCSNLKRRGGVWHVLDRICE